MAKKKNILLSNNSARNIAVNCLIDFERYQRNIQDNLDIIFREHPCDYRDRRLATELAYGTCRQLITLDYVIAKHCSRPLRQIDRIFLQILRVAIYQMIYLNRTPDFASVHEAVNQARDTGLRGGDSFVNAILRSVQRDIDRFSPPQDNDNPRSVLALNPNTVCRFNTNLLPNPDKNLAKYISLTYAQPLWLIKRWLKQFGEKIVKQICLASNSRPCLILRNNSLRGSREELIALLAKGGVSAQLHGNAIILETSVIPEQLPGYQEGLFTIQDTTAMAVAPQLHPKPHERILDLCAAPGGKATHLAELMNNTGSIIACDILPKKLDLIRENCRRLGITIIQASLVENLDQHISRDGLFDAILIDAPCSNSGVMARRAEIRHRLKPIDIQRLAHMQMELLNRAVATLKPKGRILYSTCSIDTMENDSLIQKFLDDTPDFNLQHEKLTLPGNSTSHNVTDFGWRDGGYTAMLIRG